MDSTHPRRTLHDLAARGPRSSGRLSQPRRDHRRQAPHVQHLRPPQGPHRRRQGVRQRRAELRTRSATEAVTTSRTSRAAPSIPTAPSFLSPASPTTSSSRRPRASRSWPRSSPCLTSKSAASSSTATSCARRQLLHGAPVVHPVESLHPQGPLSLEADRPGS